MKVAVTGAAGFIGAYLSRRLADDGHIVVAIDNFLRGEPTRIAGQAGIQAERCDVRDADALHQALSGVEVVFHLAAINGTENFYNRPELVLDVGVRGALAVMDAARRAGVPDIVIASSAEVYQTPAIVPTDETVPMVIPDSLNPRYSYGGSKLISELIAFNYGKDVFRQVQVFRPHNVYGPDMGWKHVIPQLIGKARAAAAAHEALEIQGDGTETRAFCYVDDIVDGIVTMHAAGGNREVYHIGSMEEVSIRDLVARIIAGLGLALEVRPGPAMEGGTPRRCPDIGKMRAIGYEPKVTLDEGLRRTIAWYMDHAPAGENALL